MLVFGMKKNSSFHHQISPENFQLPLGSDFRTELHLCVGDAFCEVSSSFVWVVPDWVLKGGGLQPGRRRHFPPPILDAYWKKKTPLFPEICSLWNSKETKDQPLFWLGVVGRFHASRGVFERGWWGLTECSPKLKGGWQGVSGPVFFYEKPMNYHFFEQPPTKSGSYTLGYIPQ